MCGGRAATRTTRPVRRSGSRSECWADSVWVYTNKTNVSVSPRARRRFPHPHAHPLSLPAVLVFQLTQTTHETLAHTRPAHTQRRQAAGHRGTTGAVSQRVHRDHVRQNSYHCPYISLISHARVLPGQIQPRRWTWRATISSRRRDPNSLLRFIRGGDAIRTTALARASSKHPAAVLAASVCVTARRKAGNKLCPKPCSPSIRGPLPERPGPSPDQNTNSISGVPRLFCLRFIKEKLLCDRLVGRSDNSQHLLYHAPISPLLLTYS